MKRNIWTFVLILLFVSLIVAVFSYPLPYQTATVDETGRKVKLYSNGSWAYDEYQQKQSEPVKQSQPQKQGK